MNNFALSKTLKFIKLCNNFLYQKNIVIFLGNRNVLLSAFLQGEIVESKLIPLEMQDDLNQYTDFFNKFRKFYIFFLVDNSLSETRHLSLPMLQSLIKTNPVEKFISEYLTQDDIVAYNVHDITKHPNELWHIIIASTQYKKPISTIVEHILGDSLKFGGIYHLALELETIIDRILNYIGEKTYSDYLQIFVTVLESSGIKLVIKYKSDLINIKTSEYPLNKSDEYIQGLIEQIIHDNLILLSNDIKNLGLKICIIFLVDGNLNTILKQSNFAEHKSIYISNKELLLLEDEDITNFSDIAITKFFVSQKTFLALNKNIKIITKFNLLNLVIFKPFIITIVILLFTLLSINIKTFINYRKLSFLDSKAYTALEEYRNIKDKYPYIKITNNLIDKQNLFSLSKSVDNISIADLYSMEALLKTPIPTPFNLFEKFLMGQYPEIKLKKINWDLKSVDNISSLSKNKIKAVVLLEFITREIPIKEAMIRVNQYINHIKNEFSNFEITNTIQHNKIINLSCQVTIPVSISITRHDE